MKELSQDALKAIVKKYFDFSSWEDDSVNPSFTVENFDSYPEENFENLAEELEKHGVIAFTVGRSPVKISLVRNVRHEAKSEKYIKTGLIIATLISVGYFGYSYQSSYDPNGTMIYNLGSSILFYLVPISVIMASRESIKYAVLKKNGMKYSPSIIIPDPLGLGTMGLINSSSTPYRSRRIMIEVASYSLLIGFLVSLIFYVIGSVYTTAIPPATQAVNLPVQRIGSPIFIGLIMGKFIPTSAIPDTLAFAGWVGLVTTSFNALPLGFLDGGLISSSFLGKNSVYLSYVSLLAIVALTIFYDPWIILALFALFVGLKGPQPLNNVDSLRQRSKFLTVLSFIVLIAGLAPVPIHTSLNQFSVSTNTDAFIEYTGHNGSIAFQAMIINNGASSIIPGFSFSPAGDLHISGSGAPIPSGGKRNYSITFNSTALRSPGISNYNFTVYSGTYSKSVRMMVMNVNETEVFQFNYSNPYYKFMSGNLTGAVLSLSSVVNETLNVAEFSSGDSFQMDINGGASYYNASYSVMLKGITVSPTMDLKIPIEMKKYASPIYVVAYNSSFDAAIAVIEG